LLEISKKSNENATKVVNSKTIIKEISQLEKRAIQFGSRIAKMDDKKLKGNHICQNLTV